MRKAQTRFITVTWIDREAAEVKREIKFSRVQALIDSRQQGLEGIADVPQLGFGELDDQTVSHPEEAVTDGGGRSSRKENGFSRGPGVEHGGERSEAGGHSYPEVAVV